MSRKKKTRRPSKGVPVRRRASAGARSLSRSEAVRKPKSFAYGEQVEGRQSVRELLLAGRRSVSEVFIADGLSSSEILDDIEQLTKEMGVSLRKIPKRQLDSKAFTSAHQGVVASAQPVPHVPLDKLLADPQAFLLVLDGVTDPQNLGSILRIAECSGVTGVVLPTRRSVKITPTVTKTAAGAVEHVPLSFVGGIPSSLSEMTAAGLVTVGLDASGDEDIFSSDLLKNPPIALVLGKEGPGLSRLTRERVDALVSIPLIGQLNSLNVAIAGSVACFEVVRRFKTIGVERE